ncbi:unnamed protein product [Calypogeia fissa]
MAMAVNKYEEARRKMLEENQKRMEELGLLELTASLNPQLSKSPTSKPEKQKWTSRAPSLPSRRSTRTAGKPAKCYKYETAAERYIGASDADIAVMEAVEEAMEKITNPAFVRAVLYSYGAGAYHGYIPLEFRRNHMPEEDEWFTLEDEDELEWSILFNPEFGDLRKGWKEFSLHHSLMAGDVCLFELVSPSRFKVHIFRFEEHDRSGKGRTNRKKGAGKGPQKENKFSNGLSSVPQDDHVLIDKKPKLEAKTVEEGVHGGEPRFPTLVARKPKLEPEPLPQEMPYGGVPLSFPVEKKPKLEPELLLDCQHSDQRKAPVSSPIPARRILRSSTWTLENPD